ncbi:DUF72 domain-containing protein [Dyadobacter sp. NIV53]|uniref:DUF72 domain-containing protein n=1 Tax=Dyadobacter sp. NIV53 TaxID=2861765 RepID=UPI001C86BCDB|nr:DUF72 domain-containing protein [Dyadobacter sp. NIV53]
MDHNKPALVYAGTSGLVLPVPNKQMYPPEFQDKSRLAYYASLFNSIEINSSFYKVPMAATVQKWAESVPDEFRFTFKLWREITHAKGLTFKAEDVDRFIRTIDLAGNKKGCLLVQFPPSLKINKIGQLEKLLIDINEANSARQWKVFLEFRHISWYHEEMTDLLGDYKMDLVIHDKPSSATPIMDTRENIYLRFHGPDGDYKGSYSEDFLHEYAQYIQDWSAEGKTVYVYFNNTMGDAIKNLQTLNNFVTLLTA